jgi:hypothetical protein
VASVGVVSGTPASAHPAALAAAGTPFAQARFASYGTGSELELSALNTGTTQLARVDQAFSGITAAGPSPLQQLGPSAVSPITGAVVQAATTSVANTSARGSGLEVGLGLTAAQTNQIKLGIAQSFAPPSNQVGTLAGPAVAAIPLVIPGLVQTGVLHGYAATNYNGVFCPVGQPLAYGLGSAAAPTTVLNTVVASPGAAQTSTRSDLIANADGTFGLATTVQSTIAPLSVTLAPGISLTVTVQGTSPSTPVTLTAATNGEGTTAMTLGNADPVVVVSANLGILPPVTLAPLKLSALAPVLNPLLATIGGLLSPLGINLSVVLGDGHTVKSPIPSFTNGTNTISGTYDLLSLHLGLGTTTIADLRLGHMEAAVDLPSGSIACTIPVAKVANPAVVQAGNTFTWTILVPATSQVLSDSTCDLVNIKATDKISVNSGSPTFTIGAISNGGVYNTSTGTITWASLPNYHPGAPPIPLTISVSVPAGSAAGVLQDTANVTAGLGNCTGGVTGIATANGNIGSAIIGGSVTLVAPQVTAAGAGLATTGTGPMLAWIAAGLLLLAAATRRVLRRARPNP